MRMSRQRRVARQIVDVGRSLDAFNHEDGQYLSRAVSEAMKECEAAFSVDDYDRAEYLAKVVAVLVKRETPKFAANPQAWIEARRELRT
jgi:hypothetical protein